MCSQGRLLVDGVVDWIMFFDAVDEVRFAREFAALSSLRDNAQCERELALLNATACALAAEMNIEPPEWAKDAVVLATPWFVSGIERLKATALLESPIYFRRNNIFVLGNFLSRA